MQGYPTMAMRYYLDHNATTPVRPEVIEAMMPYYTVMYGNASSVHTFGQEARQALDESRETAARLIGAEPLELYFTGCGTESDNIALTGVLSARQDNRRGLVISSIEHSAILNTGQALERSGYPVRRIGVDRNGVIDLDQLRQTVDSSTALVSIMHGNNETGVIQPVAEAAKIAHEAGALFHTDAVQSAGKVPVDVNHMGIDLLSMSAHKLNAPKGFGALYIRSGIDIRPLTYGGRHERGIRPGTENVAGSVGFAKALSLAVAEHEQSAIRLGALRDRLEKSIDASIPNLYFNGRSAVRLPGTANISFPGVDGEALLFSMDVEGIAVSTGSACTSGEIEPSHVLVAMGVPPNVAQSSLRFSLGWGTGDDAIEHVITVLPAIVERLRKISGAI
jgi:cysteine desulfurase